MRVLDRLGEIAAIAQHRAGYSPEEDAAHELAAGWMRAAGLETRVCSQSRSMEPRLR